MPVHPRKLLPPPTEEVAVVVLELERVLVIADVADPELPLERGRQDRMGGASCAGPEPGEQAKSPSKGNKKPTIKRQRFANSMLSS
jgi:hypothetical protein